ncbi:signal transduction histidine kinase [Podospora aff. communis PSN243]|uniref:Signal transduction histidine kinase n=1 Tax=Podospora aff. communis PSN243 TaxID=3040156 RepID=A0AAV9GLL9_9PEZI|nr:signal transduction histidine kinase [Podospora aff. communis PSN243]
MPDFGDHIDMDKFQAILDMDNEGDDREFSRAVVEEYFIQFEVAICEIEAAIASGNLTALGSAGKTLGSSSESLGFTKIEESCRVVEKLGLKSNDESDGAVDKEGLGKIREAVARMRPYYEEVKALVLDFYKNG